MTNAVVIKNTTEGKPNYMTDINISLNRRRFLSGLTAMMGSSFIAVNAGPIEAALAYQSGARGKVLTKEQLEIVKLVGEIIIPQTDTPGAIAADVHGFIDYMLADFMTKKDRTEFLSGLDNFDAKAGGFTKLSAGDQYDFVERMDKKAFARGANQKTYAFYRSLKDWVTTGFFSSEAGMTQTGTYHPLPGPMREVTRQEWLEYKGWA